jgi:hypothetical protein
MLRSNLAKDGKDQQAKPTQGGGDQQAQQVLVGILMLQSTGVFVARPLQMRGLYQHCGANDVAGWV